ncbi:hypothetical protein PIB30_025892 [Stylosanthes scabra]|uniref:Methionine gamma-lyase n=1 Tax=Stylosanthes scabra TaxID=79078 RepID=A0ABU6Y8G6_9FABA|nr:hypothetical protein [Stylosanthes scabra]
MADAATHTATATNNCGGGNAKKAFSLFADPAAALASARHEFGEHGGVNMSIEASATFTVMEPETMKRMFAGELGPDRDFFIYSRHFNPTVLNLSRQMAALEGTEAAYCTSSGMSAISSVLLQLCGTGGHVVASSALYGGTHALLANFFPKACNITASFVDINDMQAVESAIQEGKTKVLYFEAVSNPTLQVANIPELSALGHRKGLTVVVDNTFAPMVLSPARLGADVVVHSISKFISGAADIIAGAVCGSASLMNKMMDLHDGPLMLLGPTMNAKVAFELSERLPHLSIRMKEHSHRAMVYATRLKDLGIKNSAQFGLMAVSLGYYETLMSCSGSSTSSEMDEDAKKRAGISPGLIRFSVGFVGTLDQKWSQFEKALSKFHETELPNKS